KFQAAEERREQREQRREKREQLREQLELKNIRRVVEYYSRLLRPFDEAPETDEIKYINGLNKLAQTGNLTAFYGPLPADLRQFVRDACNRLIKLKIALDNLDKKGRGGSDTVSRGEINENIRTMVMKIRERREAALDELSNRETAAAQ